MFATYWKVWKAYNATAGYVTVLSPRIAFVTVHDAGHEVPAYQPARSLTLLQLYLSRDLYTTTYDSSRRLFGIGGVSGMVVPSVFSSNWNILLEDSWSVYISCISICVLLSIFRYKYV